MEDEAKKYFSLAFRELRLYKNLTRAQIAHLLEAGLTTITNYELGTSLPNYAVLIKIAQFFDTPVDTFLPPTVRARPGPVEDISGDDSKRISANFRKTQNVPVDVPISVPKTKTTLLRDTDNQSVNIPAVIIQVEGPDAATLIPVLDVAAAAGLPENHSNPHFFEHLPTIRAPGIRAETGEYYCIQVRGDSMAPTFYDHDYVVVRRLYNLAQEVREGYVHIIVTEEGPVLKRVLNRISKRNSLALRSDNRTYPTYDVPADRILALYRVEARFSTNFPNLNDSTITRITDIEESLAQVKARLNM